MEALRKHYKEEYSKACAKERAVFKELNIGKSIWKSLIPVSYTHLDVYKRQTGDTANPLLYLGIGALALITGGGVGLRGRKKKNKQ